jgi:hypothetical protein
MKLKAADNILLNVHSLLQYVALSFESFNKANLLRRRQRLRLA